MGGDWRVRGEWGLRDLGLWIMKMMMMMLRERIITRAMMTLLLSSLTRTLKMETTMAAAALLRAWGMVRVEWVVVT